MPSERGLYRYWKDGELQPIDEPWQYDASANTGLLTGQRIVGGETLLDVEAGYRDRHCIRLALTWTQDGQAQRWRYLRGSHTLLWSCDGGPERVLPLAANCRLFPLLRAATAGVLKDAEDEGIQLVLPSLHNPGTHGFLQPVQSSRCVRRSAEAGHLRYYGGEYGDAGADYWLGDHGLVDHYRWQAPSGLWEIKLDEAWFTDDFNGF